MWNCPKATLANFLSFYPWWTTYNIHLVPKSEKSTFREVVGGELQVEMMHCTAALVHEWADFSAFLYEGSICQVMSPYGVWGIGPQPRTYPSKPTSYPPREWQAVRSCLTPPQHWSLSGWRGQGKDTPGHHTSHIGWLFSWTSLTLSSPSLFIFPLWLCVFCRLQLRKSKLLIPQFNAGIWNVLSKQEFDRKNSVCFSRKCHVRKSISNMLQCEKFMI